MSNIHIYTQQQREEAMKWYQENIPRYHKFLNSLPPLETDSKLFSPVDGAIEAYFQIKKIDFDFLPTEFVVGLEYKDSEKVKKGEEMVNIRFQNPHKNKEEDSFAMEVLLHLLNSFKK